MFNVEVTVDDSELKKFKDFCGVSRPNKYAWETRRTQAVMAKRGQRMTVIIRKTEKKPDVKERQLPPGDRD